MLTHQILDARGCFYILKGKLNSLRLTIVGMCAPNKTQGPFCEALYRELREDSQSDILMMGDFNAMLDNQLHRSQESLTPEIPLNFYRYKEGLCLVYVQQLVNDNKRDYTFYWHRHNTYSRLDFILERLCNKIASLIYLYGFGPCQTMVGRFCDMKISDLASK